MERLYFFYGREEEQVHGGRIGFVKSKINFFSNGKENVGDGVGDPGTLLT